MSVECNAMMAEVTAKKMRLHFEMNRVWISVKGDIDGHRGA
jgi:hypothetical protein